MNKQELRRKRHEYYIANKTKWRKYRKQEKVTTAKQEKVKMAKQRKKTEQMITIKRRVKISELKEGDIIILLD